MGKITARISFRIENLLAFLWVVVLILSLSSFYRSSSIKYLYSVHCTVHDTRAHFQTSLYVQWHRLTMWNCKSLCSNGHRCINALLQWHSRYTGYINKFEKWLHGKWMIIFYAMYEVKKYISESYYGWVFGCSIFNTIWCINWDAGSRIVYGGNTFNFRCTARFRRRPFHILSTNYLQFIVLNPKIPIPTINIVHCEIIVVNEYQSQLLTFKIRMAFCRISMKKHTHTQNHLHISLETIQISL